MEAHNQNKDTAPALQTEQKGIDLAILFGGNSHFAYVFKKTEKLIAAVYMVTDFIKDNEPLKWKIRENALSLLSLNISLASASMSERKEFIKEYQSLALEIVSLSGVAQHAGLVSEMNFSILSREFGGLVSSLDQSDGKHVRGEKVVLDPSFFAIDSLADDSKGQPSRTDSLAGRAQQFAPTAPAASIGQAVAPTHASVKDTVQFQPKAVRASEPKDGKESRRGVILKLLAKKSGLGIKDFIDSIKGVSEKTIQRELLAMVASGVIKKEGERRWSTYSLAS